MQPVISKLRLPNIHMAPEYLHVVPFQLVKINVGAGFPVFLFPALLDHVMSFFCSMKLLNIIWSDSHEVTMF